MAKKAEIKEVKQIDALSLAKLLALIQGSIGLVIGFFFSLFTLPYHMGFGRMMSPFLFFGLGSIIILPVMYGILGFLMGLVIAFLYNLFARRIGGIKLKF